MMKAPTRIDKPWGYELIVAQGPRYVGKVLVVHKGEALSLQYHEHKEETLYLHEGRAELTVGESADALTTETMSQGMSQHIAPGTVHRIVALDECTFFETSTTELDDVVRLDDRYGRRDK